MKPRFLYPQHPKTGVLIAPQQLNLYESENRWLAQLKFQGSNCVLWVFNGEISLWNRQGKPFTHYKITESMKECIRSLNLKPDTEYVFNGELLHTKAKSKTTGKQVVTDTIALFDVLFIGKYLLTETLEERLLLLNDICRNPKEYALDNQGLLVVRNDESQIWLAETFDKEFSYYFYYFFDTDAKGNDRYPLIEGLMLKLKGEY
jgi:hypothetical protein